jgi:hypothetical protein
MSLSYHQYPSTIVNSVREQIPFTYTSTVSNNENFKFRFQIDNSSTTLYTLDQTPNNSGVGYLDVSTLVKNEITTFFDPTITFWSGCEGNTFEFDVYTREIWLSGSTIVSGDTSGLGFYLGFDSTEKYSEDYYMATGTTGRYFLTKYHDQTNKDYIRKFRTTDYATLSLININTISDYISKPYMYWLIVKDINNGYRRYLLCDNSGNYENPYYDNYNTGSTWRTFGELNNCIQSLPFGPLNLTTAYWSIQSYAVPSNYQGNRGPATPNSSTYPSWSYVDTGYTGATIYPFIVDCNQGAGASYDETTNENKTDYYWVYVTDNHGSPVMRSEEQYAQLECCSTYPGVNFGFKNSLGVFDYFRFDKVYTQLDNIDRTEYNLYPYIFNSTTKYYTKPTYGRGRTISEVDITEVYTANSGWVSEKEIPLLKDLYESSDVMAQIGYDDFIPVIITSKEFQIKDTQQRERMYNYIITFEKANKTNTN